MTFNDALTQLRTALESNQMRVAAGALREALQAPFTVLQLQRLNALLRTHEQAWRQHCAGRELRVAIVGSYTTQPVRESISAAMLEAGVWPVIYEADYNSIEIELLDASSQLFAFKPDLVLLAVGWQSLHGMPQPGATEAQVATCLEAVMRLWQQRWSAIQERTSATIIQHTFDLPPTLPLDRLEGRYAWSATNFIDALNRRLWQQEGTRLRILDVAALSAAHGRRQWFDARWYHHSKHGFALARIADYTRSLGGLLRAMQGRTRKCLVTDLDNTLWGGVIGDDGINGIALGNGTAAGEAYLAFGAYLKSLQRLGVVLAVCSKNEEGTARDALQNHPESVLRPDDFAAFVCNWQPKSENLRSIATQLNIGIDSLVFVDDNPAECEEVRRALPEVTVIEMTGDPAYFPMLIEEQHLFTPLQLTDEDLARAASYQARSQIGHLAELPAGDLEAFLTGLDMEATVTRATREDSPRLEQLFSKTNQFNFTGIKFDEATLAEMLHSDRHVVIAARLSDKHANHGLVSALVAEQDGTTLAVLNWVMSCRVFSRRLEHCLLNWLREEALERGCIRITGRFQSTAKNDYARRFLVSTGLTAEDSSQEFTYSLNTKAPALLHSIRYA